MQGMEQSHEHAAGCEDPVAAIASDRFGIDYLFPLQRMAIANILDGMESEEPLRQLVLFPTGFGKSLCFQLPALLAEGPSVVVYPLLALMNDQRRSLERRGIPSVIFRGGMDLESRKAAREDLRSGKARIAITNPESLAAGNLKDFLADIGVFHMAIDEAHCVSEWGETFRPSYLELGACIKTINPAVVSAFTATAGPEVREAVTRHLFGDASFRMVTADMDKPNIFYRVIPSLHPDRSLVNLAGSCRRPMIIFDQSRAGVRRLCELVKEATGFDVRFYHAGLERDEKDRVEAWFMGSDDGVLCATCAYGIP
jgi:ATP-dependent DNA helicase RecQ